MTHSVLPKNFDAQAFLRTAWQREPFLIRADQPFVDLISPQEMAGLACEPAVESRLVRVNAAQDEWSVQYGPFDEDDFLNLQPTHYSLMVQAVDQWFEDVSQLIEEFSFIPGWRVDDVMISYSTDQGNVGPHYDQYDVFLIQGMGRKRWQIGDLCDSATPLRDHNDLKLLQDFTTRQEWVLEPGDILYLPPGVAHYGVALGDSMTYSVGFRAPSIADLLEGMVDEALQPLTEDQRYKDSSPQLPRHAGEISADVFQELQQQLQELFSRPELLRHSFGKTMTQRRYPMALHMDDLEPLGDIAALRKLWSQHGALYKTPGSRFAYSVPEESKHPALEFYVDGETFRIGASALALVQALSAAGYRQALDATIIDGALTDDEAAGLLLCLYNQGSVYID